MSNATQLISQTGATQLVPPINAIVLKSGLTPVGVGGGAVTSVAGRTGAVTLTSADLTDTTPAGRALLDDADAAAQRTTLGLGSAATADSGDFAAAAALASYQLLSAKGVANGYASLDSGGQIPAAQIPAIALSEYLGDVADESAMLALTGEKGDWCTRQDDGATWIISGADPSILAGWTSITYPASPVTSVAGKTGVVTIAAADISDATPAGQAIMAAADAAAQRTALGLGTAATTAASAYATAAQGTTADNALQPSDIASGTITARADDIDFSGGSDGDVLTVQADGSLAIEPPAGGSPGGSTNELQRNDGGSFGGATGVTWASNQLLITAQDAATTPLAVRAAASHSANIQEWQNSAGTAHVYISSSNRVHASGGFSAGISGGAGTAAITYSAGKGFLFERFGNGGLIGTEGGLGSIFATRNSGAFGWQSGTALTGGPDTRLIRTDAAQIGFRGSSSSVGASINLLELSADPSDPAEGQSAIWQSDGTGSGDDGDIMVKITAGGVTKTATLIDFSAV